MTPEIPDEHVTGRAVPLPEEQAGQGDAATQRAAAEEILRDSEQRVAEATESTAPGDVADEHRRSEDSADL